MAASIRRVAACLLRGAPAIATSTASASTSLPALTLSRQAPTPLTLTGGLFFSTWLAPLDRPGPCAFHSACFPELETSASSKAGDIPGSPAALTTTVSSTARQTVRMASYKVYTRTGDKGESSLYNGERRAKDDLVFAVLGDTDELNSMIGVAREFCAESADTELPSQLSTIQSALLDAGSAIATPADTSSERKKSRVKFDGSRVDVLEGWIDAMDEELPQLTTFILPSGGKAGSFLHLARTICRRAERGVVPLVRDGHVDDGVGRYLNRLSDYLFTAARYAALKEGKEEVTYKKE